MDAFFDTFRVGTGWQAFFVFLDMAIVFFVIYRILLLIKGTRALQMLFGLVFILVAFFLSQDDFLNLSTTHWMIDIFIANFIIIVVIIFQEDIRRALAHVGRAPVLGGTRSFEETSVLEEVIKACVMLSNRQLGALIAIEREADLSRYVEEGIPVDSVVSKDVLFTLFLPEHQNPLHDGAVIIRQGRIAAAGCFLPLTVNPRVEKSLGTRHRAGIGVTEDTDAAVAIVSEESGRISLAHNGELFQGLDANEMRALLQGIYSARDLHSSRSGLFDRLRNEVRSFMASREAKSQDEDETVDESEGAE
jgi:diadenylate cyclase